MAEAEPPADTLAPDDSFEYRPLVAKGEDRQKVLDGVIERWATETAEWLNEDGDLTVDLDEIRRSPATLVEIDLRDDNTGADVIDLGRDLLHPLTERLRDTHGTSAQEIPRAAPALFDCRIVTLIAEDLDAPFHLLVAGRRTSIARACFLNASIAGYVEFLQATFDGEALFDFATFSNAISFDNTVFRDQASFQYVEFCGDASFDHTDFGKRSSFNNATFDHRVNFNYASFGHGASFRDASLDHGGSFDHVKFGDIASFQDARFRGLTHFREASFGNDAWFSRARFSGEGSFEEARLGDGASFDDSTFGYLASFCDASFGDRASFSRVTFNAGARFDNATLGNATVFDGADFRLGLVADSRLARQSRNTTSSLTKWTDRVHWRRVRALGELTAFTRVSYLTLAGVPLLAGLWGPLRRGLASINGSLEATDQKLDRVLSRLGEDAASLPQDVTATLRNVGGLLDGTLPASMPTGWLLAFLTAFLIVVAQLVYQIYAPGLIREVSEDELVERANERNRADGEITDERLREAIGYLHETARRLPHRHSAWFVRRHTRTVWIPDKLESFEPAMIDEERPDDAPDDWEPRQIEAPDQEVQPEDRKRIAIEEGQRARYAAEAFEAREAAWVSGGLYTAAGWLLLMIVLRQLAHVADASAAPWIATPFFWLSSQWLIWPVLIAILLLTVFGTLVVHDAKWWDRAARVVGPIATTIRRSWAALRSVGSAFRQACFGEPGQGA